ncbi:MAG: DUF3168 domain-containing protein [Litoreibacter sp.]
MSYRFSTALQTAVFEALRNDANITNLVGDAIFDAEPGGTLPSIYITLGSEQVRARSDTLVVGALHEFVISVITDAPGFASAKAVGVAVGEVLVDAELVLDRGTLVSLRFYKARSVRIGNGKKRRIDLTFRAQISD